MKISINRKTLVYSLVTMGILICLFTGGVAFFFMPGGLRSTILPNYVESRYPKQLREDYDHAFVTVGDALNSYGLRPQIVADPTNNGYIDEGCGKRYSGFRATYSCNKVDNTLEISLNRNTLRIWQSKSKEFEQRLLADGWIKQPSVTEAIDQITSGYRSVNYDKEIGRTLCSLSIGYHDSEAYSDSSQVQELRMMQACAKDLKLFGGY
jgi:hypothetical protein